MDKSEIEVIDNGTALSPSEYEIVEYKNHNKEGTAKVTIKGLGKYGGEKTISFKIKKAK